MSQSSQRYRLQMRANPVVAAMVIGCLLILGLVPFLHLYFAHGPGNPAGADHCPVCLQLAVALFAVLAVFVLPLAGSREMFRLGGGRPARPSVLIDYYAARSPPYSS